MANLELEAYLQQRIVQHGPMSIAEYMQVCLYHPQWGYYCSKNPIGAQGDFITAPEISQLFGEMIGVWLWDLWCRMGKPKSVHLIELGPGYGTLMQDCLRGISKEYRQALSVHLVEVSASLQKKQQQTLEGYTISWQASLEEVLQKCAGEPVFIIANEFFDALPIHQLYKTSQSWQEKKVTFDQQQQKFVETLSKLSPALETKELPDLPEGSTFEICLSGLDYMEKAAQAIAQQSGAMLLIDYGHCQTSEGNTLQAVRKHHCHDVFNDPGSADITAHVDFEALANIAGKNNVRVWGPTLQGTFLSEMGVHTRAQLLQHNATMQQKADIERSLHRLVSPTQMGRLFKVLSITSYKMPTPSGFATCIPPIACAA